jgi:hypothetical protein
MSASIRNAPNNSTKMPGGGNSNGWQRGQSGNGRERRPGGARLAARERVKVGRGNRTPDAVIDTRIAEVVTILSHRTNVHRCELHRNLCERWGCHWRTVDRIVARARVELAKRYGRKPEDMRVESAAFYEAKANDPKVPPSDQIKARNSFDDLFGLKRTKVELSGPDGGPLIPGETEMVIVWPHETGSGNRNAQIKDRDQDQLEAGNSAEVADGG